MRTQRFIPTIKITLMILLAVGLSSIFTIHADNPSPNGWSLSGGGFCEGTYTVFNSTLTPNPGLYAENCATGKNDCFSSTDIGALMDSCVFPNMKTGGQVSLRQGFFSDVTPIIVYQGAQAQVSCGIKFVGSGGLQVSGIGSITGTQINGTNIVAKTNGKNVIQATNTPSASSGPQVIGCSFADFNILLEGTSNTVGIDFQMKETRMDNAFYDIGVQASGGSNTTGIVLDGNEDTLLSGFQGGDSTLDVQWKTPAGNVIIQNSAVTSVLVDSQIITISTSTVSQITIAANALSNQVLNLRDDYLGNLVGTGRIQMGGFTVGAINVQGCIIDITSTIPLFAGTGTDDNSIYTGNTWIFGAASNWNAGGATLSHQISGGANPPTTGVTSPGSNNVQSGSAPTNFPFTITSGNF